MASDGLNGPKSNLSFYPAYCYKASPTYFAWVKLTAFDVHNLLYTRRGFEGQSLYFYLNHPIQFVYLVGVVVSYEDFHEKRWLFIIDDSSGSTIEVTCPKPQKNADGEPEKALHKQMKPNASGSVEEPARSNIIASVDIGSVVKVKGKVGVFRDTRQIQLERISIVPDTNAEMHFWEQRTKLKIEILSKPWKVPRNEQIRLFKVAQGRDNSYRTRSLKQKEREAAKEAREMRHAKRIAEKYNEDDVRRKQAAEAAREAGQRLMAQSLGESTTS